MAEPVTKEMIYQVLRSIEADIDIIREDLAGLKIANNSQDRKLMVIDRKRDRFLQAPLALITNVKSGR